MLPSAEKFLCILFKCKQDKHMTPWLHLHSFWHKSGMESHTFLGGLLHAQQVLNKLPPCHELSWNALIIGYSKCSEWENALALYHELQEGEFVQATSYTFVALLKACNQLRDLDTGCLILGEIARTGFLDGDVYIGSSIVDLFANCGSLLKAQELFDKLSVRNVAVWNALIAGYVEHGCDSEALCCYLQMQDEGISADATTFVCTLKACGKTGLTEEGQCLHDHLTKLGLEGESLVGNALVFMYATCGLEEAQSVFEKLVVQTEVSHTSLLTGYVEHGHGEKALNCFQQLKENGIYKDAVTFVCGLKACGSVRAIDKGRELYMEITCMGLERGLFTGSVLIDMYGRCGLLADGRDVYDQLLERDVVSWTTLILGYVENGLCEEALEFYEQICAEGLPLGSVTFACTLRACGILGALTKGQEIHCFVVKLGLIDRDCCVDSTIVDMYSKCGLLLEAHDVFNRMLNKTVVAWTSLIAGYVEHGHNKVGFECYERMKLEGVSPSAVTNVCTLRACAYMSALIKGQTIHIDIVKRGMLEEDVYVGSSMIDMYAKCGALGDAYTVFDRLREKDVVSWTALISGYIENEKGKEALSLFQMMESEGMSPVLVTFVCALKACCTLKESSQGQEVHNKILIHGHESELSVCHVLIDMYGRCGLLVEAQNVFNKLKLQDSVSWTALISGYVEHGAHEEVLKCLEKMQSSNACCLDVKIAVCILKACSSTGAEGIGHKVHAEGIRRGLDIDPFLGNALVDMYAKCGSMAEANRVLNKLSVRNVISWTSLIAGYAEVGESEKVIGTLDKMLEENVEPDAVTYVSVLNACSHSGLVERGEMLFLAISHVHGLIASEEHFICVVDLFCRAGLVNKAIALIEEMPYDASNVAWQIVLGACRKWGDVELGKHAFGQAVQLQRLHAAAYVCMYNIYADADASLHGLEKVGVG